MKRFIKILLALVLLLTIEPWETIIKAAVAMPECDLCHSDGAVTYNTHYNPTCEEEGYDDYICHAHTIEHHFKANIVPATGHNYAETSRVEPTCTTNGFVGKACTNSGCTSVVSETLPATGHHYEEFKHTDATCTEAGSITYICSDCKIQYTNPIAALGHDYHEEVIKEATCTEEGEIRQTCSRCHDSSSTSVAALGHDYHEELIKESNCEEEGEIRHTCSRCTDSYSETVAKKEHQFTACETVYPTCSSEGQIISKCDLCGKEEIETTEKLPHVFADEWVIEKEPSALQDGEKSKICAECGYKEIESIEATGVPIEILAPVGATVASAGAIVYFLVKKKTKEGATEIAKKVVEEAVEHSFTKPSIEEKTIVTCMDESNFYKMIKANRYISVVEAEYDELADTVVDEEPDLVLIDFGKRNLRTIESKLKAIREKAEDVNFAILVNEPIITKHKDELERMKKEKLIANYSANSVKKEINMVKLILPAMKPKLNSDETLENIGAITDMLGISGVSTVINIFTSGREIKETLEDNEEGEIGLVDASTIIGDCASILGLDTAASVIGLIGDIDDIKSSLEAKTGANELATMGEAALDIIDVLGNND